MKNQETDFLQWITLWFLGAFICNSCGIVTTKVGTIATLKTDNRIINKHYCLRCLAEKKRIEISQRL